MLRSTGYTALVLYGLSIFGAVTAPGPGRSDAQPVLSTESKPTRLSSQALCGFAINLHHTDQLHLYLRAIDTIVSLGFNSVEITTPAFQDNGGSEEIRIETGVGRGPHRWQLLTLLHYARSRGLTTVLMPQILFTSPRGNEWRGKIHPERWHHWWRSYRKTIDYFLDIADEAGVDVFCIGSELMSTERQTDRWSSLIAHARRRFKGRLAYSTNWDHYHVPTIWRDLDMIGISGYWDMTANVKHQQPTPEELAQRWQQIRQKVLAFAKEQGRPILFTEIGYPSLPWALQDPWNYVHDGNATPDLAAQAKGYAAFLSAWDDLLNQRFDPNQMTGVFFYAWDPYPRRDKHDTGYGVRGKPALELLKQWMAGHR